MTSGPVPQSIWNWKSSASLPVGLGGSVFGWIVTPAETDAILDRFFELGGRFIDTSDGYSYAQRVTGEDSESLIGSWVRRRSVENEIRIITKVGLCPGVEGLAPPVIARAAEASLDRLGVPAAEAILAHADDGVTAPEDVAEGLSTLVGPCARHIGVSRFTAARLAATRAALKQSCSPPIDVVQEEFSLAERGGIDTLLHCSGDGQPLGVVCSAALARGFLTGKFQNASERVGARQAFVNEHYGQQAHGALLGELRRVAHEHDVTPAAVAIRWLLQHESVALPLVSVTNPKQLDAFSEADAVTLTNDQWSSLDKLSRALRESALRAGGTPPSAQQDS